MKKPMFKSMLFATGFLLVSNCIIAQSQPSSIQVQGAATYTRTVDRYTADIILSHASYDGVYKNLTDIKKEFNQFLKYGGFNAAMFKEDSSLFFLLDGYGEGTLYRFETTSKEEFVKLAQLYKLRNVKLHTKKLIFKPVVNGEELARKALEDARKKGTELAVIAGKKLGAITEIIDLNPLNGEVYNYDAYESKEEYVITVKFVVE